MAILRDAEEGSQVLAGDAHALVQIVVLHQTDGGLAAQGGDLALQIAHARFTGVGTDDLQDGAVGQRDVLRLQAVFLHLSRQQEVAGDLALFRLLLSSMISMRSSSGAGMVSSELAVVMKNTLERSYSRSR